MMRDQRDAGPRALSALLPDPGEMGITDVAALLVLRRRARSPSE